MGEVEEAEDDDDDDEEDDKEEEEDDEWVESRGRREKREEERPYRRATRRLAQEGRKPSKHEKASMREVTTARHVSECGKKVSLPDSGHMRHVDRLGHRCIVRTQRRDVECRLGREKKSRGRERRIC